VTVNFNSSGKLVFSKSNGTEIEITKFDPIPNPEAQKARAKEILHFYGGYSRYQPISETTIFSDDHTYCLARDKNGGGLASPPLQVFPDNSPLDLVKKELKKEDVSISGVPFFSDNTLLTAEQIKQIKKDQERVVRLAVKARLRDRSGNKLGDDYVAQKCFTDKESKGKHLSHQNYGLMSSYIAPTTFYLNQSGNGAAKKAVNQTRAYITGFGYPVFDETYCTAITAGNQDKKDELKAIFKQQIYAVLLSRQQQIDKDEITEDVRVPLILNRAYDFVRVSDADKAELLQQFINATLVELFSEEEVADAMKGKIDKVLLLDGPKEDVEFFGDIDPIKQALQNSALGVEALKIDGHDMISLAQAYKSGNGAMIAIPIMANPVGQDGEGAMKGLAAAEESFCVAMGGMPQMLLNGEHNEGLPEREIEDSGSLEKFMKKKVDSNPLSHSHNVLEIWGVPIGAGLAGAGVVVLCASALSVGIVSAPVVATAVVVGVALAGATAVTLTQGRKLKENGTNSLS